VGVHTVSAPQRWAAERLGLEQVQPVQCPALARGRSALQMAPSQRHNPRGRCANDGSIHGLGVASSDASHRRFRRWPNGHDLRGKAAAGDLHSLALRTAGAVVAWGSKPSLANATMPVLPDGVTYTWMVKAGANFSVARRKAMARGRRMGLERRGAVQASPRCHTGLAYVRAGLRHEPQPPARAQRWLGRSHVRRRYCIGHVQRACACRKA
jgi:hypothetical protein